MLFRVMTLVPERKSSYSCSWLPKKVKIEPLTGDQRVYTSCLASVIEVNKSHVCRMFKNNELTITIMPHQLSPLRLYKLRL